MINTTEILDLTDGPTAERSNDDQHAPAATLGLGHPLLPGRQSNPTQSTAPVLLGGHDDDDYGQKDDPNASGSGADVDFKDVKVGFEELCPVCGDRVSGYHYGLLTCESCKGFFKRTVQNKKVYSCVDNRNCQIDKSQRKRCPYCRFQKCLSVGMKLEAVRSDRMRGGRNKFGPMYKRDRALKQQAARQLHTVHGDIMSNGMMGQGGMPGSPEDVKPDPLLLQASLNLYSGAISSSSSTSMIPPGLIPALNCMSSTAAATLSSSSVNAEGLVGQPHSPSHAMSQANPPHHAAGGGVQQGYGSYNHLTALALPQSPKGGTSSSHQYPPSHLQRQSSGANNHHHIQQHQLHHSASGAAGGVSMTENSSHNNSNSSSNSSRGEHSPPSHHTHPHHPHHSQQHHHPHHQQQQLHQQQHLHAESDTSALHQGQTSGVSGYAAQGQHHLGSVAVLNGQNNNSSNALAIRDSEQSGNGSQVHPNVIEALRGFQGPILTNPSERSMLPPLIAEMKATVVDENEVKHKMWNFMQTELSQTDVTSSPEHFLPVLCRMVDQLLFLMVEWARNSSFFKEIKVEDQMKLLHNSWSEILILDFIYRQIHNIWGKEIVPPTGPSIGFEILDKLGLGDVKAKVFELIKKGKELKLDFNEFMCLKFLILLNPDVSNLENRTYIGQSQEKVNVALFEYCVLCYPDMGDKFSQLLLRLPEIRLISIRTEDFLYFKHLSNEVPDQTLLTEMLHAKRKG